MRTSILRTVSVLAAIAMLGHTSSNSPKYFCQWFVYDDPSSTGVEYPFTLVQARNQLNYRSLYPGESVSSLCPGTEKICAICAENTKLINGILRPVINGEIIESKLNLYFSSGGNSILMVDYPGFIAELDLY